MTINIGIATHRRRLHVIEDAILSLYEQDLTAHFHIYLNDYGRAELPNSIRNLKRITYYQQPEGDLADIGKFYGLEYVKTGYYLTADDDFIYPKDYIQKLTHGIRIYGGKCVIGFHGRRFKNKEPLECFYKAPAWKEISTKETQLARLVHVIGTGVMGFDVTKVQYNWRQWHTHKYMSDLNMLQQAIT